MKSVREASENEFLNPAGQQVQTSFFKTLKNSRFSRIKQNRQVLDSFHRTASFSETALNEQHPDGNLKAWIPLMWSKPW